MNVVANLSDRQRKGVMEVKKQEIACWIGIYGTLVCERDQDQELNIDRGDKTWMRVDRRGVLCTCHQFPFNELKQRPFGGSCDIQPAENIHIFPINTD